RGDHLGTDQHRFGIGRAAMHDPVADAGECRLATDMGRQPVMDDRYRGLVVLRGRPLSISLRPCASATSICAEAPIAATWPCAPAASERSSPVSNTENLMLDEPALM